MPLQAIGKLGRYQIVRELSEGAMGTVFEAVDPLIERTVAIKTIKLDFSKDELVTFEERFLREAKSAGRLNHPNIVTIYDIGESNNVAYLAMEYLEGQTLREMLDSGVTLSVGRAVWIAAQIAEALSYAEEHGVVHRDIKPANIILTRRGQVKLTDFGIAVLPLGSRTQSGMVMGSPKYMSPEQAMGLQLDTRSDIFSLGAVLYEMLTGKPPFDGDNLNAILYRVMNEEPATPGSLNPRIPPGLNKIVVTMLEKKPERRHKSAKQLARQLRVYQTSGAAAATAANSGIPVNSHAETLVLGPSRAGKPASVRSKRAMYAGVCAGVVCFGVALFFLTREEPIAPLPTPVVTTPKAEVAKPQELEAPKPPQAAVLAEAPLETTERSEIPEEAQSLPVAAPNSAPTLATLSFAVAPWGEIYVDNKKVGVSPPMSEVKIAPGRHKVEIRNTYFVPYSKTIIVKPDANKKIRHRFQ